MKSVLPSILSTIVILSMMSEKCAVAFSPTSLSTQKQITSTQLGIFGLFQSPEEKEKARLRKEAEIEEQERLLAEMRERRTNPEKMEEYEIDVVKRRAVVKSTKRDWEVLEDKIGESGYVDGKKQ